MNLKKYLMSFRKKAITVCPNSSEAAIVPFFRCLVQGLQPFCRQKNIKLDFIINENETELDNALMEQFTGFIKIIASVIDYMPDNNTIYLTADVLEKSHIKCVSVKIRNTGINLKMVTAIIKNRALPVTLFSSGSNETTYEVCYPLISSINKFAIPNASVFNYITIVKAIQTHFTKLNNPISRLSDQNRKKLLFLLISISAF